MCENECEAGEQETSVQRMLLLGRKKADEAGQAILYRVHRSCLSACFSHARPHFSARGDVLPTHACVHLMTLPHRCLMRSEHCYVSRPHIVDYA